MVCPKCGEIIEDGLLYCTKCGKEITIVPDYNFSTEVHKLENALSDSVSSVMDDDSSDKKRNKEETAGSSEKKYDASSDTAKKSSGKNSGRTKDNHPNLLFVVVLLILVISLLAGGLFLIRKNYREHSFDYQYSQAIKAFDLKDYDKALSYTENAKNLEPDNIDVWKLRANIALAQKDYAVAENSYRYILDNLDSSNQEMYMKLINLLIETGEYAKVKELIANSTIEGIKEYYADYTTIVPTASYPDGEYFNTLSIELSAEGYDIYYTLDGSTPTANSTHYVTPIILPEGTTTIRAISVSPKGISSDEAIFKYEISHLEAELPEVSPASGTYSPGFQIVVTVPDGCTVLYTLNGSEPTLDSEVYEKPITVNSDVIFKAISISLSDRESEVVTRTYHVAAEGE